MNGTRDISPVRRGFALLCFIFYSFFLSAQLPNGFTDVKLQSGYTAPMGVIFSKNGQKMFVWEKIGKLWCSSWNGTTYVKQATPTLDISEEVGDWRDFGLQSVALDPNFDANGLIYLFYQVDRHYLLNFGTPQYSATTNEYFAASISRLTRYKITTTNGVATADNASRKILLGETKSTGVPLLYESHAGGQIVFGTDGTLMVTTGDNASFNGNDFGNDADTYWQQAINDGILRPTENVGAFRSQLINSFCGKLLRLDPNTGDGIASNPFYDATTPRTAKSRTWALGFRNPYRMTFKNGTGSTDPTAGNPGTVIVGDVQNGTWEEFDMIEKGGVNCGWPLFEGIEPQYAFYDSGKTNPEEAGNPTFLSLCVRGGRANINNPVPSQRRFSHFAPALDWNHTQNIARYVDYTQGNTEAAVTIGSAGSIVNGTPFKGNCVTAGTYYTKTAFPTLYQNVFFFADYGANWIKAASLHDNSDHQLHEVIDFAPDGYGKGIVDIECNPLDGSIVYVNINTGDIQRISFGATNRPPVAVIGSDKTSGTSPLTVNFTSTGSSDPDGDAITYKWDFADGSAVSTEANPTHTFVSSVSKGFTVTLTVTDASGLTDVKTVVISTNNTAPSVQITNPVNNSLYTLTGATQVTLQSTVTDNDVTGMQYAWQVTLRHNNHEHREPINTLQSPTVQTSPIGCDGETYYYFICLTVTDNGGLTAKDSVKIYPDCNSGNISISNLKATPQTNAVAVTWTNSALLFDEVMVVAKEGSGFLTNPSGTTFTADASFTGAGTAFEGGKVVYRGTGANITVTSLTASKTYYFRVFTRKGTTWTGGVEASAVPLEPIPVATNLKATAQTNAAAVTWTNPVVAFDEVMIVAQASGSITATPSGTTYTADANFTGNGSTFGTGKVIYRGTGTSVTATNLTAATTYYFRLFVRKGTVWTTDLETTAIPTAPVIPVVTNLQATAQVNAAAVTWTSPTVAYDEVMVVVRSGSSNNTLPSGTTYTADANFTGTGTTLGSGKVVYRGTGTSVTVTNLTAATTYYFRVYIRKGTVWTSSLETTAIPTAPPPPSVTNLKATAQTNAAAVTWTSPTVTYDEVMVVARLGSSNTTLPSGTTYTANSNFTGTSTALGGGKVVYRGTGTSVTVTNLTAATTYYFRVYIRKGTVWTNSLETTAIPTAPAIPAVTNLVATAQVNAAAVTWTNPTIAYDEVMVVARSGSSNTTLPSGTTYTANSNFTGTSTSLGGGNVVYRGTGTSVTVTNLTSATTYYFRVYIRKGTVWTNSLETTAIPTAPSVTNLKATAQTNAAAITWTSPTVTYDELMVVVRSGSSNNTLPSSGTTYTANSNFTGTSSSLGSGKVVYRGTGTSVTVTNLTAATTYYFRVYIRKGTIWTSSLETTAIPTAPPLPAVTNLTASAQTNAAALTWTNPIVTYDELMVVARSGSSNTTLPSSGTTYTANSNFTGTSTALGGGKVVYRGTGTSVTVTNLTAATTYYFRVYIRKGTVWTSSLETTAIPTAVTAQLGCLKGSYFNNVSLSGTPTVVRAESSINYDWAANAPVSGIPADNFSVRWEGTIIPPRTGTYTFSVTGDDGVRLWVNNVQIINRWVDQSPTTYTATISLTQGQNVPIKLEYYERTGNAMAKLFWTIPNQSSQVTAFTACPLPTFSATSCYKLTALSNSKVLVVPNSSTTNGTQLQVSSSYTGSKSQLWRIKDLGDGSYRLVNTNSGKSADVLGSSTSNNAAVVQWDWLNGNNQRWLLNKNTAGYYQLIAKHSGKAMDATNTNVVQNTASSSTAQQFKIEAATCPVGAVASESANILAAQGYRDGKKAVITWVSDANDNTDYFSVQRLNQDQQIFEKIQIVNALPRSAGEKQSYAFSDIEPNFGENNIYRVVLYRTGVDIPQYSELISVDFSQFNDVIIFPNPANDYVDIDLETIRYRAVDIVLMDASGKIVQQKKIASAPVEPVRLDLQGLPTGAYFIHIESEGKREVVKKLMIAR